jgi:hypothetical protein
MSPHIADIVPTTSDISVSKAALTPKSELAASTRINRFRSMRRCSLSRAALRSCSAGERLRSNAARWCAKISPSSAGSVADCVAALGSVFTVELRGFGAELVPFSVVVIVVPYLLVQGMASNFMQRGQAALRQLALALMV